MQTDLRQLAVAFGTPLYAFDARALAERVRVLRAALPQGTGICFAIKANPFVLPELEPLIDRLEVCSPGEYRICEALGLAHGKLVVSGVHKDAETVESAIAADALPAAITVESLEQLDLVVRTASWRGVRVPVLLRLTSGNQFGMAPNDLIAAVRQLKRAAYIDLRGIQFFSGTQKTSLKRIARELARLDAFMRELDETCGWMPPELEYGPGLPVAYFEGDAFDEAAYLTEFSELLEGMEFSGRITLELGRSLVAASGTYLTRVVDTKVNGGQRYAIVDGGIHQLVYYGQSMAMHQPPVRLLDAGRSALAAHGEDAARSAADAARTAADTAARGAIAHADASPAGAWTVCGSLCTVNDILAKQLPLAGLEVGDILAFERTGAYSMTEGISLFLSRDLPAVVVIGEDGAPALVRDALRTDIINTPLAQLGSR
ncbi:diaminopimelate decarboxylase family protein [Enorma burkinafasonensis]|uniref:diaminopimelate decarboxylase family protein n=1 Tax=Enorma burkinafasonensis TaxID=2590867 RepID=UPI00119DA5A7|nr:alanine racemase [Enorma burkinafasonensis]